MSRLISHLDLLVSEQLIKDLAWSFDFDLGCAGEDTTWIILDPPAPFVAIAGDGAGGIFLVYGEGDTKRLPVLYVTSEGQAGRVASNLTEFLGILMDIPYWRDLLHFSNNGSLPDMRKTAEFSEHDYLEGSPELPDARQRIMSVLSIPKICDPIKTLHDAVHATDCMVVAGDGYPYEGLFNSFKPTDNPSWGSS